MTEKWASIAEFTGRYEISDCGRVRSIIKQPLILKPGLTTSGYPYVQLRKDSKQHPRTIHRLMAHAFLGPIGYKIEVNHKDGNKTNNMLSNLELVTRSENISHRIHVLKANIGKRYKGSEHYYSKLNEGEVIAIRGMYASGIKRSELAAKFGCSKGAISHIVKRRSWTHI